MDTIEAIRDVNPEVVKCVVCGTNAHHYMDFAGYMPVCQNVACYETVVSGINKLLVVFKNQGLEVA